MGKQICISARQRLSSSSLMCLMLCCVVQFATNHRVCLLYPRGLTTFHRIHRLFGQHRSTSLPRQETRFISNEFLMNAGMHCGAENMEPRKKTSSRENIKNISRKNKLIDASDGGCFSLCEI